MKKSLVGGKGLTLFQKMFRRKPIGRTVEITRRPSSIVEEVDDSKNLDRVLGALDLMAFGIASCVGSGIFVIAGVAGQYAGAGLFLSFVIGGVSCLFCGLCYCEFATRVPVSGSAYTYTYCALGEIVGFLIGWDLTLEYGISAAAVAQGWSSYLQIFLSSCGVPDKYLPSILFGHNLNEYFTINIMAGLLIMGCTVLLIKGIRESATFTNFVTLWNILLIAFYTIAGAFYVDTENWFHPCSNTKYGSSCSSDQHNAFFPQGFRGVVRGAGIVFFSYVGFDAVSCLAEETKNVRRNMALGILGTLTIATCLYVGVSLVLLGMVPFTALDQSSPLADAFKSHNQSVIAAIVSFGALTTTCATTLTSLLGQPRIFYRMSKDGLFFSVFGRVHKHLRTLVYGSLLSGVIAALIGTFINFSLLAEMISVGTLMAYILICSGVIILRYPLKVTHLTQSVVTTNPFLVWAVVFYAICCIGLGFALDELNFEFPDLYLIIALSVFVIAFFFYFLYIDYTCTTPYLGDNVFLCPWCPVVPALGIFSNSYMIASLKWDSFARVVAWFFVGLSIYIFYGSKHSKLNFDDGNQRILN
ncbi:amino acid permease-associated region, partial [Reticulomyxa filosa]